MFYTRGLVFCSSHLTNLCCTFITLVAPDVAIVQNNWMRSRLETRCDRFSNLFPYLTKETKKNVLIWRTLWKLLYWITVVLKCGDPFYLQPQKTNCTQLQPDSFKNMLDVKQHACVIQTLYLLRPVPYEHEHPDSKVIYSRDQQYLLIQLFQCRHGVCDSLADSFHITVTNRNITLHSLGTNREPK